MKKEIRKIGIITGGGDCSGLNAVINGITKTAINKYGVEVVGFTRGYSGLFKNTYRPIDLRSVSGIMHEGGTILKSSNNPVSNSWIEEWKSPIGCAPPPITNTCFTPKSLHIFT